MNIPVHGGSVRQREGLCIQWFCVFRKSGVLPVWQAGQPNLTFLSIPLFVRSPNTSSLAGVSILNLLLSRWISQQKNTEHSHAVTSHTISLVLSPLILSVVLYILCYSFVRTRFHTMLLSYAFLLCHVLLAYSVPPILIL